MKSDRVRDRTSTSGVETGPSRARVIGLALIALAAAVSLLLALQHLAGTGLPGCGEGSPCWQAASSRWGSIPLLGWPVAYVGLAYFMSLGAAWLGAGTLFGPALRMIVRVGASVSVFYIVVSIGDRLLCPYCLAVQGANLGVWLCAERLAPDAPAQPGAGRAPVAPVAVFVLVTMALVVADVTMRRHAAARAESGLKATEASLRAGPTAAGLPEFTGRYRAGSPDARVRLVIFTDYQCPDCRRVESDAEQLLRDRPDVFLSIKHFPFCTECNPHAGRDLHPNACRAARAAEAAGLLAGTEGFWRMHRWLFERAGVFTDADLRAAPGLGLDPDRVIAELAAPRTLALVRADTDEAAGLAISRTPTVFVNGIELRGWEVPGALARAAEAAAAPTGARADRPPDAITRLIQEWQEQPEQSLPPPTRPHITGPSNAGVRVVLFGDYQEPNCAAADALLRRLVAARTGASYEFRHFPIDQSCNPAARVTLHPLACRMARAVEGAAGAGGEAAFWAAHAWTFEHQRAFTDAGFREALASFGISDDALAEHAASPETVARIDADCRVAESLGLTAVPLIYVNGRRVPRWTYEDLPVMDRILDRASQ